MSTVLLGRTLAGRFRITGFIGEGAMASVYRGSQDAEPRDVAIKVMHPHLTQEETFVKRFRREAKAAAQIKHPSSVQILEYGVDDGLLFIAMELLTGRDLFEILVVERRFSEARAARIVIEALGALAVAHDLGIVHRDLKPENIMVMRDRHDPNAVERVKVLDFGIAKILDHDDGGDHPVSSVASSVLTTVGVVVGTPEYMSPEQCRGEVIDARSDIYACGVLLFQLLTGRTPFTADSPVQVAMMHLREDPPSLSSLVPGLHRGLEAVVMTALSKWPAQRQQSARALAAELQRLLPELSAVPHRLSQRPAPINPDGAPTIEQKIVHPGGGDEIATLTSQVVEPITPAIRAPVAIVDAGPKTEAAGAGPAGDDQSRIARIATPAPSTPMVTGPPRPVRISPLAPTPKTGNPIPNFARPVRAGAPAARGAAPGAAREAIVIPVVEAADAEPAVSVDVPVPSSEDPATPALAALASTLATPAYPGGAATAASPAIDASLKTTLMGAGPIMLDPMLAAQVQAAAAPAAGPGGAIPAAGPGGAIPAAAGSGPGVEPGVAPIHNTMASAVPVALNTMASASPVALPLPSKGDAGASPLVVVDTGPYAAVKAARSPQPLGVAGVATFPWLPVSVAFSLGVVTGVALCLLVR